MSKQMRISVPPYLGLLPINLFYVFFVLFCLELTLMCVCVFFFLLFCLFVFIPYLPG